MAKRLPRAEATLVARLGARVRPLTPVLHCGTCPHESYLTTSIALHQHCCDSCGAVFIDTKREKRYFGKGPRATAPKG